MSGRLQRALGRRVAAWFSRRRVVLRNARPIISFTFDDFPASAYTATAPLFAQAGGLRATFYTSLGLLGTQTPTGRIVSRELLQEVLTGPHEVACHTYDHFDAFETSFAAYRDSVSRNLSELRALEPLATFENHSYPISFPRLRTKRFIGRRFVSGRAGGQTHNAREADLAYLRSFFIERSREKPEAIREEIDRTVQAEHAWLLFSTHDVAENPTEYGCTPALFERVLQWAIESGAQILSVKEAIRACGLGSTEKAG